MNKRNGNGEIDQELFRALSHPLRVEILRILSQRVGSPTQLSALLEEPLVKVAYHTKVLADRNCIELVETRPARGAVEHIYRAKSQATLGTRSWQQVPQSLRSDIVGSSLHEFTTHVVDALQSGAFEEREGSTLTWLPLTVDERGWEEIEEILSGIEEKFQAVAERCSTRLEGGDGTPIVVAVAAFEAGGKQRRQSA